jgi:crossover junction endodeoxyribonuclease RusA
MTGLSILLPWPPSTNTLWRAVRGRNILSEKYRAWRQAAGMELMMQQPKKHLGPVAITIELCSPDKRRWDIDNKTKATLDLLVEHGVIEDDSASILKELTVRIGEGFTGAWVGIKPVLKQEEKD